MQVSHPNNHHLCYFGSVVVLQSLIVTHLLEEVDPRDILSDDVNVFSRLEALLEGQQQRMLDHLHYA